MSDSLVEARLGKIEALKARGIDPFPARVPASERIDGVLRRHGGLAAEEHSGARVGVAGRLMARRQMGKASFLDLRDGSAKIQIHAAADRLGDEAYRGICDTDVGDFLHIAGEVFRTKRGELTVAAESWTFLAKAIRPLPEKWHGLKDVELRYRHRSLDLLSSDETRERFVRRAKMMETLRSELTRLGFLEVETPSLHPIPGGTTARPFATHHNALDVDLYLRIALEIYLKRALIGGLDRVFEIGKCFRNEGVSTKHNPEFTMLELYQAYTDYEGMMRLAESLVGAVFQAAVGSLVVDYQGTRLDFSPPWHRVAMLDAIAETSGLDLGTLTAPEIVAAAKTKGIGVPNLSRTQLIEHLFDRFVEPTLIQPTIVTDYPVEISPLAKRRADAPHLTERFELFVMNMEIANAFSELNDPVDQRVRFEDQERLRAGGDEEAQRIDEDFLFAMEHGMPPTGGMGVGLDRLAMLLSNSASIRDVILFPALRRKDEA
ncbi:MAG: lysine--tRNA ligase [Candidatus Bipolaricaulis sp.]|nr:lysine--tRNA ligase [Candidatus Bipolaricaulis sp.]